MGYPYKLVGQVKSKYKHYVVYYYADYHDYQLGEVRDSRIEIYAVSDITYENNSFVFGEGVECYYLTNSKYITSQSCPDSFSVKNNEIVYTDLIHSYPDLCYFQTEYNNFDYKPPLVGLIVGIFSIIIIIRVIFGGK